MNCSGRFSLDDSRRFARLSGDFNPLHVDPVYARRTQFGSSVVHGIHVVLHALDRTYAAGLAGGLAPGALTCTFHAPVRTEAVVDIVADADRALGRVKLTGSAEGRLAFSATLELAEGPRRDPAAIDDRDFEPAAPVVRDAIETTVEGTLPLRLNRATLRALFPALAAAGIDGWIADLLGSTQLVGMACPGMDSVYLSFKLRRTPDAAAPAAFRYRVEKSNPKLGLLRMAVAGAATAGSVEALVRPRPIAQRALADVQDDVTAGAFAGQRALVVGGSRGIGEATAKLLAAGGADVTITWQRGEDDARRICAEAAALGRRCAMLRLDAAAPEDAIRALEGRTFTHVYWFASPAIARNATGAFDAALFGRFATVYVDGFAAVCAALAARLPKDARPLAVFCPSTVFLDAPENGFAEYCAAKAAAETLCDHLARFHRIVAAKPRLPRIRTDQTSGVQKSDVQDAFAVMGALLPAFHAAAAD